MSMCSTVVESSSALRVSLICVSFIDPSFATEASG
jgi:hypothetical protein